MRSSFCAILVLPVVLLACASTQKPKTADADKPALPDPLAFTTLTADTYTPLSYVLHVTGKLGPGVDGQQLKWSAKDDHAALGSGTLPITVAADRTFTADIPIAFAKTLSDLDAYEKADDLEVTVDGSVGGASAQGTAHLRSPHLPVAKILTVQATRSGPESIELTYNFALDNNNNLYPLKMSGMDYKAYLGGKLVADVQLPNASLVAQASQMEMNFNQQANSENCGKDIKTMVKQKKLAWGFNGVVHYPELDVPFTLSGELELAKE
jgi:hypothetical protein